MPDLDSERRRLDIERRREERRDREEREERIIGRAMLAVLVILGLFAATGVIGIWVTVIIPALNAPA